MNCYEHTLIAKQDLPESQNKKLVDKYENIIKKNSGKIVKTEEWGLMNFARAIKNNKLRWALTTDFAQSNNELAITSAGMSFTDKDGNDYIQHIIDRTFVDEDDLRWIVDYKTSFYNNEMQQSQQQFIDEQVKKYQPQLNRYAQLFAEIEHKKQVRVLYFSYIDAWVEV